MIQNCVRGRIQFGWERLARYSRAIWLPDLAFPVLNEIE